MIEITKLEKLYQTELPERPARRLSPEVVIKNGLSAVLLDVDSTVSVLEAIDRLALLKGAGVYQQVTELTELAMSGALSPEDIFFRRLEIINATTADISAVAHECAAELVPAAADSIEAMDALGVNTHLVSGGYQDIVEVVGQRVGVPKAHVHANAVTINEGGFARLDPAASPLWTSDGKRVVLERLKTQRKIGSSIAMVGDGATDAAVAPDVDVFIGFGGVVARDDVARQSPFFIRGNALSPVLVLAAGERNWTGLMRTPHAPVLQDGMLRILAGEVDMRDGYEVLPGRIDAFLRSRSWTARHFNEA